MLPSSSTYYGFTILFFVFRQCNNKQKIADGPTKRQREYFAVPIAHTYLPILYIIYKLYVYHMYVNIIPKTIACKDTVLLIYNLYVNKRIRTYIYTYLY